MLLALIGTALLAPLTGLQEPRTYPRIHPVTGPLERVVYDIGTGRSYRLRNPEEREALFGADRVVAGGARAQSVCFKNTQTMGFFATGTIDTEWRDWATKRTGKSGVVTRFFFTYATSAYPVEPPCPERPSGNGASIEVAFYTGETGFCTRSGVEIPGSRFTFTAMPATVYTQCNIISERTPLLAITAFVPSNRAFCVPDGPIGWSFGFVDGDGSGSAITGPIMTSFVSENTGAADAFDLYNRRPATTGTCLGTFFFGGCEPLPQPPSPSGMSCASFYIGLVEDDGSDGASSSSWNPVPANPDSFATVAGPALCHGWEVLHSPVTETRSLLAVSLAPPGPAGNLCRDGMMVPRLGGTGLYAIGPYLKPHSVVGTVANPAPDPTTHFLPVSPDLQLVGQRFCTQGFGIDFAPITIRAKNALVVEVGTSP